MELKRYMKVGIGSFGSAVFGVIFGWVIFPVILKSQIKKEMALTMGTDIREMWTKVPFALDFKIYLFNCTNPDEVHNGGIPIVREVGPYYFEEWKEKVNMEDVEAEDAITYNRLDTFYFIKSKSGPGLTGEEIITMPHVFIMSLAIIVQTEKPAGLSVLGKALDGMFHNPQTIFTRTRAMDIMFHGMDIDCSKTDFAPKSVCSVLKKEAKDRLIFLPNNQMRFSLFGLRNGTPEAKKVKVLRGKKDIMSVGKVIEVNGEPELNIWRDKPCTDYGGTDGTIFPPFLTPNDRLESYSIDACRTFRPRYQKKSSYKGILTNRYVATIGDLANDPELNCYCDAPDQCLPKGLMYMRKCLNAPFIASMPHFLDVDPSFLSQVKGLNPDVESHGIDIDFEPLTGTPMQAKQRLQFNIMLAKIEKLELFKNLPGTLMPLFWIEEAIALNDTFVKMMNSQLFIPKRIVGVVRWSLLSFGLLGVCGAALVHFKSRIINFAVSPDEETLKKDQQKDDDRNDISFVGQPKIII